MRDEQGHIVDSEMLQHLLADRDNHNVNLQALEEAGEVALGWRSAGADWACQQERAASLLKMLLRLLPLLVREALLLQPGGITSRLS